MAEALATGKSRKICCPEAHGKTIMLRGGSASLQKRSNAEWSKSNGVANSFDRMDRSAPSRLRAVPAHGYHAQEHVKEPVHLGIHQAVVNLEIEQTCQDRDKNDEGTHERFGRPLLERAE
jgi:hypothetical protein